MTTEPILIAASEAAANSDAFKDAHRRATEAGVDLIHVKPEDAILGADKRGDPQAYAWARKCAAVLGVGVTIANVGDEGDANNPPDHAKATHLDTEDKCYVVSGSLSPREYQRITSKARAERRQVVPLRSWDDAPQQVHDALKALAS